MSKNGSPRASRDEKRPPEHPRTRLRDYVNLLKPRIVLMVLVTTTLGFYLASGGIQSYSLLSISLLGVGMLASGAAALNNFIERHTDALMDRTKNRPLPTGRIAPKGAFGLGVFLVLAGSILLAWKVNELTAFLGMQSAFLYVLVYTPMKRLTWWNTTLGAVPGALPPLMGWTAATNELSAGGWILFFILFLWQHPHFYAIAWMFKEDYARAGLKMLPVIDPTGKRSIRHIIAFSVVLIPVSLLPCVIELSGAIYFFGALLLGLGFLFSAIAMARDRTRNSARNVLRTSIVYLPALLLLIVADAMLAL